MKNQIKSPILLAAFCTAIFSANAQNTNPWPAIGNVGIGTNAPTATLELHTDMQHSGFNLQSQKIVNQMADYLDISPADPIDIFSIWREWKTSGGFTYMASQPYFRINGELGDMHVNATSYLNGYVYVQDVLSVGKDAYISGHTYTNSIRSLTNPSPGSPTTINVGDYGFGEYTHLNVAGNIHGRSLFVADRLETGNDLDVTDDIFCHSNIFGDYGVWANQLYAYTNCYADAFILTSDKRFKKDLNSISDARQKLMLLKPYEYHFRADEFPEQKFDNKKHFGFLAQDVQKVFPELAVEFDSNGYLGVNYIEFIPLLVETMQEDDRKIKEMESEMQVLKDELATIRQQLASAGQNTSTGNGLNDNVAKSMLSQNVPNPFSKETRINYAIAEKFNKALIGIYDLNGKQIKTIGIETAKGEVAIPANEMPPGMYVYSLVVDGSVMDSKRMVVTE